MITLKEYNYDTKQTDVIAEVSLRTITNALREPASFSVFLESFFNSYGVGRRFGKEVGENLRHAHNSLQHLIINSLIGILEGFAETRHTDARNDKAILACKTIADLHLDTGPLR